MIGERNAWCHAPRMRSRALVVVYPATGDRNGMWNTATDMVIWTWFWSLALGEADLRGQGVGTCTRGASPV